ncbi:hypothetical protein M9H77_26802 [Catharanthus roseus]|uniref:Uncharacterized protein n=1 Tax=Catharanthus roseus TaxID=4058 RepID=A0ACC0ABL1_CATRO|nr:hypothetical protein M9H77_26802 [Catharanthus roseus]
MTSENQPNPQISQCKLQVDNGDEMLTENQPNTQISQFVNEKGNEEDHIMADLETQRRSLVSNPVLPENEQPSAQMPTNGNQQNRIGPPTLKTGRPTQKNRMTGFCVEKGNRDIQTQKTDEEGKKPDRFCCKIEIHDQTLRTTDEPYIQEQSNLSLSVLSFTSHPSTQSTKNGD